MAFRISMSPPPDGVFVSTPRIVGWTERTYRLMIEVSIYPGGPGTQAPSGHCVPGWVMWSTRVPNSISILRYTGGVHGWAPGYRSRVCVRRDIFCNITFLSGAFTHFWASSTKLTGIAWRTPWYISIQKNELEGPNVMLHFSGSSMMFCDLNENL